MQEAAAANPSKISVKYLQSTTQSDYVPNINTFLGEKCGIIVTVGFLMAGATQTAAEGNPSAKFAIVDYAYTPPRSQHRRRWCSTPCRTASSAATWPRA